MGYAAIQIENLSKQYQIGAIASAQRSFRETITDAMQAPYRRFRALRGAESRNERHWALRDISVEVQTGEAIGVIGRNGAGKSTLLKILSRITEPTSGTIHLRGRVGSLLEVGTGFHPELTGRENISLNGAILGMRRQEIRRQFDSIVEFAGLEQFIDTPVKRYSTGMYVRLAFAVAAHLEPEILLVDEVLAVGDAEFQDRCLGRMKDVASGGRTVLFVSHDMHSISSLCTKGIFLQDGQVAYLGEPREAIRRYLNSFAALNPSDSHPDRRPGTGEYRFTAVSPAKDLFGGAEMKEIRFRIERRKARLGKMFLQAEIADSLGAIIAVCDSRLVGPWLEDAHAIEGAFRCSSPWLKPGVYRVNLYIKTLANAVDRYEQACLLNVSPVLPYPNTACDGIDYTFVLADFEWHTRAVEPESTRDVQRVA